VHQNLKTLKSVILFDGIKVQAAVLCNRHRPGCESIKAAVEGEASARKE
jgi:hypothetical protein